MVKPGRPLETWTSTDTGCPTAPFSVADATVASMWGNGRTGRAPEPRQYLSGARPQRAVGYAGSPVGRDTVTPWIFRSCRSLMLPNGGPG